MDFQRKITSKLLLITFIAFCTDLAVQVCIGSSSDDHNTTGYWRKEGEKVLQFSLQKRPIESTAKNVILFLGDGMSLATVTATRVLKGQKNGKSGEEEVLSFDQFPYTSLVKTYGLDRQTSDSANTATAYLCGVKANYGTIGVDGRVQKMNCESSLDKSTQVPSILQWAQDAGKWTGFVTSTRVTHATPAGLYAHTASRDWESASPDSRCEDIATQLVRRKPGQDINVILGGGKAKFRRIELGGDRNDSSDLLTEWLTTKRQGGQKAQSVFDRDSLKKLNLQEVDYLLGLFDDDHLPYVADRNSTVNPPNLVELTETAIRILGKQKRGYFLMVEGGKIDLAHHQNWARKALEEGVEFDKAIESAVRMTDIKDTLIVVTADHAHTLHMGGNYPLRGTDILGLNGVSDMDNKTITVLTYANGPGYTARVRNWTEAEVENKDHRLETVYPMNTSGHGAEDVAVYARGPMAHLLSGVYDQSYIPYVMGYAACIGPNKDNCSAGLAIFRVTSQYTIMFCTLFIFLLQKLDSL